MKPTGERAVSVGRIVHYWTSEGVELVPNAALVVAISDTEPGRVWLHVFFATGFGGNDRHWATYSEEPREGAWSWPRMV